MEKHEGYIKIICEKCGEGKHFPEESQTLWCCGHHTPSTEKYIELAKKKNKEYQEYLRNKDNDRK